MPYLIDGHNLIPKLAGFSLSAMDDEMQLISLLQTFSRVRRQPVEVYFDRAPAGHAGVRRFGTITAHFVPSSRTADDAIRERLARLGADARNWRVVSARCRPKPAAGTPGCSRPKNLPVSFNLRRKKRSIRRRVSQRPATRKLRNGCASLAERTAPHSRIRSSFLNLL